MKQIYKNNGTIAYNTNILGHKFNVIILKSGFICFQAPFGKNKKDTGSVKVQIAIFTARINEITEHLKSHKKDVHSRFGLIKLVSKRRKLLSYLRRVNVSLFNEVTKELGIRV